jgi:thiamine-monophosphate kinase
MAKQPDETSLIQKYLAPIAGPAGLGLADDAACMTPNPGMDLVITTDTIVEGVHFLTEDSAHQIAIKAITVNLSDLVAKGAKPTGFLVALSLPEKPGEDWISDFALGLSEQANGKLIGGDITLSKGGPLTISVTAIGEVPSGRMVRRNGARVGDEVYVSGQIGTSAMGLKCTLDPEWAKAAGLSAHESSQLISSYKAPKVPGDQVWPIVQKFASASLDVSDGLAIDLERLCAASNVGAVIEVDAIPMHKLVRRMIEVGQITMVDVITGGDDYVALFTVPSATSVDHKEELNKFCHHIGKIVSTEKGVTFSLGSGQTLSLGDRKGYDHFSND